MGRITAALEALSKRDKRTYDPMPTQGRDALTSHRDQIVWIADTLERIAGVLSKSKDDAQAVDAPDADTEETPKQPTPKTTKGKG